MLDLSNSLIVCSLLLLLMFLVAGSWGSMAVTGHMGVENPYVKKGVLPPLSPKTLCPDVQSVNTMTVAMSVLLALSNSYICIKGMLAHAFLATFLYNYTLIYYNNKSLH